MLKVYSDFGSYRPWSGAVENYQELERLGRLGDFESLLEECYPEGMEMGQINDILWFDFGWVKEMLGITDEEAEEDEEEDE